MAYGSVLTDNIQSSTANTPVVFKDGNGTQIGTLCRAWVNFNGTGTVAIRSSFNVSSITDNGTGDYTVNFTTALPDTNYMVALGNTSYSGTNVTAFTYVKGDGSATGTPALKTTTQLEVIYAVPGGSAVYVDCADMNVSVFR